MNQLYGNVLQYPNNDRTKVDGWNIGRNFSYFTVGSSVSFNCMKQETDIIY
jgi:hypothetical protein